MMVAVHQFGRALLVQASILVAVGAALGQPQQLSGKINGTVTDAQGVGLSGATVVLSSAEGNASDAQVLTDAHGQFALFDVKYGTYTLAAALTGYQQAEPRSVAVSSPSATLDFILLPLSQSDAAKTMSSGDIDRETRPPAFSPSGIQGTIAPSGYSTGLSLEDTSQVMDRVGDFSQDVLAGLAPVEKEEDCDQEPELLNAARANPESFGPNYALGAFYLGHGEFQESTSYLKKAFSAMPTDSNTARALALAYMGAGLYPSAASFLEGLTAKNTADPVVLRLLAIAYEGFGDSQKANAAFERAASLDGAPDNLFDCGMGLIAAGAEDGAVRLFTSATVAHPGSERLWTGLGIALDLQKHQADAIRALLRAIDINPEYLPPYSFLAALSGNSPETDTQIRRLLAALVVAQPESAVAHYDYALALWKQRAQDPDDATAAEIESELSLALAKDPHMVRAHFQLGLVYAGSGDDAKAEAELRETVQLDPENAEAHYRLAQVYRREKQTELANLQIKDFLALHGNPTSDENSPEAEIPKLTPQLSRTLSAATPCHVESR